LRRYKKPSASLGGERKVWERRGEGRRKIVKIIHQANLRGRVSDRKNGRKKENIATT